MDLPACIRMPNNDKQGILSEEHITAQSKKYLIKYMQVSKIVTKF